MAGYLGMLGCAPCTGLAGLGEINPDIFKASFSAREAAKQLILLEDHLAQPSKRCPDCINKHKLAAEAFAEEACTLDGAPEMPWLNEAAERIRTAQSAADVRSLRKDIVSRLGLSGLGTGAYAGGYEGLALLLVAAIAATAATSIYVFGLKRTVIAAAAAGGGVIVMDKYASSALGRSPHTMHVAGLLAVSALVATRK